LQPGVDGCRHSAKALGTDVEEEKVIHVAEVSCGFEGSSDVMVERGQVDVGAEFPRAPFGRTPFRDVSVPDFESFQIL
jgi:hypothetical protein